MNPTTRYEYMADMARIDRLSAPDISDRAYTVTASFEADRTRRGSSLHGEACLEVLSFT